ncbi:MAG: ATP synthase F0 subunit B [Polyangiaceae bacterium]|jgi:F-type H+-transporting ATPase subunit b
MSFVFPQGALLAPQAINVDVDLTFVVVGVLFVALTLILKPLLFDPLLKLFEEREKRTEGARAQARQLDERSTAALATIETTMSKAREAAGAERETLRAEAARREQEILAAVRSATAKTVEDGKRVAQAEADRVREALRADAQALSRELAARVLGRGVQS